MDHPSKFTPIIISTSIIVVISLFPLLNLINIFCCAGVVLGTFTGTSYYASQLRKTGSVIQYKDGAAIGVLSGLISALIVVAGSTLLTILVNQNPVPEIYKMLDSQGITMPPEAEEFLRKISDEYSKNGFSITLTLVTLIVDIISFPVFGAAGGLLSSAVYSRKKNIEQ